MPYADTQVPFDSSLNGSRQSDSYPAGLLRESGRDSLTSYLNFDTLNLCAQRRREYHLPHGQLPA